MNLETIKKLKEECQRELKLRKIVYPKLVAQGRKKQEDADEQIHLMALAAACFNKILKGEAPEVQQILFEVKDYTETKSMYEWGM